MKRLTKKQRALFNKVLKKAKKSVNGYVERTELNKLGFHKLDSGAYAIVYKHKTEPNLVLKRTDSGDNWVLYAREAKKNASKCPALPRIYAMNKVGDSVYAMMERLGPLDHDIYDEIGATAISSFITGEENNLPGANRHLKRALRVARRVYNENECCVDIHRGNLMMRGEQTVLTDQLS